jgi:uncharacterized protein YodC (DUF2158 family)
METNTLKIGTPTMIVAQDRKMVWNRLWNPIQRVYKGLPKLIFMPTTRERGPWNHKGPWNGQTPLMETNTLKIGIPTMIVAQERKLVWNRLWNPIQGVYMGVATTYLRANYPGTWCM